MPAAVIWKAAAATGTVGDLATCAKHKPLFHEATVALCMCIWAHDKVIKPGHLDDAVVTARLQHQSRVDRMCPQRAKCCNQLQLTGV